MRQQAHRHFLYHEPSSILFAVGLLINVLLIGYFLVHVQMHKNEMNLALDRREWNSSTAPRLIAVGGSKFLIGKEVVDEKDLPLSLSSISGSDSGLVVVFAPGTPAEEWLNILKICNRAGFTNLAVELGTAGTPAGR